MEDYNPWQTMSLRTVPEKKYTVRKQLNTTNDISDIAGAKPAQRIRAVQKPDFHNPSDIRGTRPATLIPKRVNRPILANTTIDIEGAQAVKKRPSNRVVDPLNPTYQLPSFRAKPPTPAKFTGDRMDVSDIVGTKPRAPKKASGRDMNDIHDIEGSSTDFRSSKFVRRDAPRDFNDVSDIMSTGFKTKRTTNGLKPSYVVNGMSITDDDPGMAPRQLIRERARGPSNLHDPSDIPGASAGYKTRKMFANRRQYRNPVAIDDIPGAAADTVVNQLRTKRVTNPNNPNYTALCGSTLGTVTKPSTPDPRKSTFFSTLDADGDGEVTYQELLQAADVNNDGSLTVAELHKFAKGKISDRQLNQLMRQADRNNDGVISRKEGGHLGRDLLATAHSSNQEHTQSRARTSNASRGADADEIDRLRAELEMLRKEAKVLSNVPSGRRSRVATGSSSQAQPRSGGFPHSPVAPPRSSGRSVATACSAASRGRSSSVTASGRKESVRARRERIATAREIEAVRNLP